jgi:hypothetical protein
MDPAYRNAINLTQFAPLLGRFYSKDLPGNVQQISDSWDFDLHKSEVDLAKSLLKEKLKGNFASRPLTKDESQAMSRYDYGGGTNSVLKQLGARWILQNIIMDKPAVFKQNVLQSGHLLDEDPS